MAQNLANLNPQQLQQLQIQAIQSQLQAPAELGTNKLLINVNGQNSKLPTNKNGIVKYTLEQPVKLEIGDRITLVESFVEERGLAVDTISFEEDIEEEIRFLYYIQGDCRNSLNVAGASPYSQAIACDQEFTSFPNVQPDCYSPDGDVVIGSESVSTFFGGLSDFEPYIYPNRNYSSFGCAATSSAVGKQANINVGANGQYYYMCEYFNPQTPINTQDDGDPTRWNEFQEDEEGDKAFLFISEGQPTPSSFMRPFYGATTIKIPAGNYSVSALSDLINNQLNGTAIPGNPTRDKLIDKMFHNDDNIQAQQVVPAFTQINQKSDYRNQVPRNVYNPDVDIIGEDTHQCYDRRRGDIVTQMFFNYLQTSSRINMDVMRGQVHSSNTTASPIPKWADGNTGMDSEGSGSAQVINTCGDPIIYDRFVSNGRTALRSNGTNFYMHLDGFKHLFGKDVAPEKTYWNKDYSVTGDDMAKGLWNQKFMPTLFDQFVGNIGLKGKFYFNTDVHDYNPRYNDDDGFGGKPYYFTEQNAGTDPATGNPLVGAESHKFCFMYPVKSSSDDNNPSGNQTDAGNVPIDVGIFQQFAGTTAFSLDYDSGASNRFTISNLHEPYKMASRTPDNKSSTNVGGQQATIFNTPVVLDATNDNIFPFNNLKCGVYPIDSAGGIAVNNFSFSSVKNTKVYKDLVADIAALNTSNTDYQFAREAAIFELFTKPYDEFFDTEAQAKEAWATTIWNRIGFTYDQLGNVSNNLETIYTFSNSKAYQPIATPRFIKQMGIITHNAFDYTFIPSTSGLGSGNPADAATASENPQNYGLRAYTAGSNFSILGGSKYGFAQNYINVLCDSKPIVADAFPSLNNGNNYLIIESDIVKTNAKDSNSNSTTIVGVMSKENATNDTIFSVNPITFINTEPRLLATIEVRIKNPDGTLVSDEVVGKNNGFIFQIEKAIKVGDINLQSL